LANKVQKNDPNKKKKKTPKQTKKKQQKKKKKKKTPRGGLGTGVVKCNKDRGMPG